MKTISSSSISWQARYTAMLVIVVLLITTMPVATAFALDAGFSSPTSAQTTLTPTTLDVANATGTYGVTVNLSATLKANGTPLGNQNITFSLFGNIVGTALTDNTTGVASLSGVSISGYDAGISTNISATFEGDNTFNPITGVGQITITKAPLTVIAVNQFKVIGTTDPTFDFYYTGLVNGETQSVINVPPTCTVSVAHTTLGYFPITCSGGSDNDYSISSYVNAILTVQAEVQAYINGDLQGTYDIGQGTNTRQNYAGVNSGPVKVISTAGGVPIITSERVAYSPDGGSTWTSYAELMGLPAGKLTDTYLFPWYNSLNLSAQVSFANVDTSNTTVTVTIGGVPQGSYPLTPNQSMRIKYPGVNNGPVKVQSTSGVKIVASERISFTPDAGATYTSYYELMGLPASSLTTSYLFPWYNSLNLSSQVSFANVGTSNTTVTVTIGGVPQGSYPLTPNQSLRIKYPGLNTGPVKVESTGGVPIVASERVAYTPDGGATYPGFSEMMGLPVGQLTNNYYYPGYNSLQHSMQVSFANVGNANTTVTVTIAGVPQGSYLLIPNQSMRLKYTGLNTGPVQVSSTGGVPIITSERVSYTPDGGITYPSFSEILGLPAAQLTSTYLFPWYNSVNLDTQLRIAVP